MMNRTLVRRAAALGLIGMTGLSVPHSSPAQTADTPAARRAAALEYVKVIPSDTIVADMIDALAKQIPAVKRDEFVRLMNKMVSADTMKAITVDGMVKHFTVAEIQAMTAFYGSSEGRSILKKLGPYMGDLLPRIQQEVLRALEDVRAELQI